jgi:hypothetical protein
MQTIGVVHTKGGVGKSAVAVFLADVLSSLHENHVLLVDLDPQGSPRTPPGGSSRTPGGDPGPLPPLSPAPPREATPKTVVYVS